MDYLKFSGCLKNRMAKITLPSAFGKVDMLISSTIYPYRKMLEKGVLSIISISLA
jgi:hypothetical protein